MSRPDPANASIRSRARSRAYELMGRTLSPRGDQVNATFLAWTGRGPVRNFAAMVRGARTPEELETLLEDAFVMRDGAELRNLYGEGAVLAAERDGHEARGGEAIEPAAAALWDHDRTYVAGARRVLQARDLALVVADAGVHVLRRGGDGGWRVAISLLDLERPTTREAA